MRNLVSLAGISHDLSQKAFVAVGLLLVGTVAMAQDKREGFRTETAARHVVLVARANGEIVENDANTTLTRTAKSLTPGAPTARLIAARPWSANPLGNLKTPTGTDLSSQRIPCKLCASVRHTCFKIQYPRPYCGE